MNPTFKFALTLLVALEISFINSWTVNILITVIGLIIILISHPSCKQLWKLFLGPFIPAVALAFALIVQSRSTDNTYLAVVLFTRIYAYVFIGSAATLTTPIYDLVMSLEQNAHVPTKFIYGFLGGFNLMSKISIEIKRIRIAALMRGISLHIWSPQLYLKAIISALRWSNNISESMISHGFVEDAQRTHSIKIKIQPSDWVILISDLILLQVIIFGLHLS